MFWGRNLGVVGNLGRVPPLPGHGNLIGPLVFICCTLRGGGGWICLVGGCFVNGDFCQDFLRELQQEGGVLWGELEGLREDGDCCMDFPLLGRSCPNVSRSFHQWVGPCSSNYVLHGFLGGLGGKGCGFSS